MPLEMQARDLYLRYTNPQAGAAHIQEHRVWDAERFFDSQVHAYGTAQKKDEDKRVVEVTSREQYMKERKRAH